MTWIAVEDPGQAPESAAPARGPRERPARRRAAGDVLAKGSLYIEASLGRDRRKEQSLFVLHRRAGVKSHVSVQLGANGTVVFGRRLGRARLQVVLNTDSAQLEGVVRLTVSWDTAARRGLLSVENVALGTLVQKDFADPLPLLHSDIARLNARGDDVSFAPALRCVSLSDRLEPVGISPSFAAGTPLRTPRGYRPVEDLCPGDTVLTTDGHEKNVCWVGAREVPARGRFRPIRLHAPYFGLLRDVVVAPEQRLALRGSEVEYLFGEEAVLVEAHELLNSAFAAAEPAGPTIRYHQVLLDRHELLDVAGAGLESLFVGHLRDMPDVLATTVLRNVAPEQLPRHKKLAYPALRDYEAVTLRAALLNR